jgi:hypothetical protein
MNKAIYIAGIAVAGVMFARGASAVPVYNPDNGHYYETVYSYNSVAWNDALEEAAASSYMGMTGHLATLTSEDESQWAWFNLGKPYAYFLGASDEETEGVWEWVTGEDWDYANWWPGEPNDLSGDEDYLEFWHYGSWNDNNDDWRSRDYHDGYIIEYETAQIPEPGTLLMIGAGFGFLAAGKRLFKR